MRFLAVILCGLGLFAESPAEVLFQRARPSFRNLVDPEGIPHKSIWALARDPEGRIWAGTPAGITRYDGRGWKRVELPIPSWRVWVNQQAMGFLEDGTLWVGTRGEGLFFFRKNRWENLGPAQGLPSKNINCFLESRQRDRGGRRILYAGTWGSGLARYQDGRWTTLDSRNGLSSNRIICLFEARDDRLWVATQKGLGVLKGDQFEVQSALSNLPDQGVRCLAETVDSEGVSTLWIGLEGVGVYALVGGRVEKRDDFPGRAAAFLPRKDGGLWVAGLGGGLALWDGKRWERWGLPEGLPSEYLRTLLEVEEDGRRILWIGSDGRGIFRLPQGGWRQLTLPWPVEPQVLNFACLPDGTFLMGSQSAGLVSLGAQGWQRWDPSQGAPDAAVRAITLFKGDLWLGGAGSLITKKGTITRRFGEAEGLPSTLIRCMANDHDQTLWIGTTQGLARWNGRDLQIQSIEGGGPPLSIRALAIQGGRVWVGADTGLFVGEQGVFRKVEGLLQDGVAALAVGVTGVWIGGFSGQIHHLQDGRVETIPGAERRGSVRGLVLDGTHSLYAATVRGVERWNLDTRTLDRQFGEEDGLPDAECLAGAILLDDQGRIWVGTTGGPAVLDRKASEPSRTSKGLWVESVRTTRGPFITGGLLAPLDGSLRVEFALRAYHRERETRYQTQLLPLEWEPAPWSPASDREFPSLPRGSYTLRIWAKDYQGLVTGPTELPFRVRGKWSEHPMVLTFLALAVAATGGALAKRRYKARQRELTLRVEAATAEVRSQKEELVELNRQQKELMGILAHDLRNPVSGIALAAELLQDEDSLEGAQKTAQKILKATGSLSTLLNQFLNLQAFESGQVQVSNEPVLIGALIQESLEAFTQQAQKKAQRLEMEGTWECLVWADPHLLREVVDNLISNALKYSPHGAPIVLRLSESKDLARVEVVDQGPGLSEADRKRLFQRFARLSAQPTGGESSIGLGLSIAKGMLEAMGGKIGADGIPGHGSTFWLELPKVPIQA